MRRCENVKDETKNESAFKCDLFVDEMEMNEINRQRSAVLQRKNQVSDGMERKINLIFFRKDDV